MSDYDEDFIMSNERRKLGIDRRSRLKRFGVALGRIASAPFRGVKFVAQKITWSLWGKRRYKRRLKGQIKRMRELAGVDGQVSNVSSALRQIHLGRDLDLPYRNPSLAQAEHDNIIKTRIVHEELPKPDVDDTGMN